MKLILALLIFFSAQVMAATELPCDLALSPPAQAMIRLLRASVNARVLKVEELLTFQSSFEFKNPYVSNAEPLKVIFFRNAFDSVNARLNEDDRRRVKSELVNLVESKQEEQKVKETAQAATREFLAPKMLRKFVLKNARRRNNNFSMGWWQGRPVFMSRFNAGVNKESFDVLVDPFNASVSRQIVKMEMKDGAGSPDWRTDFFELNGKTYSLNFKESLVFDLQTRKNASGEILGAEGRTNRHSSAGQALVQTAQGFIMIAAVDQQLLAYNLSRPGSDPKLLTKVKTSDAPPTIDFVGGHPIVSHMSQGKTFYYDLAEGKQLLPKTDVILGGAHDVARLYEDQGRWLSVHRFGSTGEKSGFRIVDLKTGRQARNDIICDMNASWNPHYVTIADGIPYLYFTGGKGIILFNLRNGKRTTIKSQSDIVNGVTDFTFNEEKYLIWGGSDGYIEYFDFKSKLVTRVRIANEDVDQVIPFEYSNVFYALVSARGEMPYLARLSAVTGVAK